jgi:hypothetical protein
MNAAVGGLVLRGLQDPGFGLSEPGRRRVPLMSRVQTVESILAKALLPGPNETATACQLLANAAWGYAVSQQEQDACDPQLDGRRIAQTGASFQLERSSSKRTIRDTEMTKSRCTTYVSLMSVAAH